MPDSHHQKYVIRLLLSFVLITVAFFVFSYGLIKRPFNMDWYVWAFVASFLFCAGLYFFFHACVHKVKSDIRRRQRRDYQKQGDEEIH